MPDSGASKAGLDMLARVMALELGQHEIRVNCVNPTVVLTEMGVQVWSDPAKSKPLLDKMPLKRFAGQLCIYECYLFYFKSLLR